MSGANRIAVANAPCSYGAFEITVGVDPNVPEAAALLKAVADAGYSGIDLGPLGYLGTSEDLPSRLAEHGLGLAGGYFEVAFDDADALADALPRLDELLDVFDACAQDGAPPPLPTLADAGSQARAAHPGVAQSDRSLGWDDRGWEHFARTLERLGERCRARGYEPTFHPHTATYVEAPWEIERMLELTDIGVTLDTGHLLLGGGDPLSAIESWNGRINHLHVKDARLDVIREIVADSAPVQEIWRRRAFCRLGAGDVALPKVLERLDAVGYSGWLVVEQDILPDPADPEGPAHDQELNREYLRSHGL
jgi:inosose dehydratase